MEIKAMTTDDLITEIITRYEHEGKLKRSEAVKRLIKTLEEDYGGTA